MRKATFRSTAQQLSLQPGLLLIINLVLVWLSGRRMVDVMQTVSVSLGGWRFVVAPGLVLFAAFYCCGATLQVLRGKHALASQMMWEAVGWATLGVVIASVLDQAHLVPIWLLLLVVPLLGEQRPRWRRRVNSGLVHGLGLGLGVALVLPLVWMFTTSLRAPGLPQPERLEWWPQAVSFANYERLVELLPLARYFRNSIMLVGVGVPLSLLVASAAGFALVHLPAPLRRFMLLMSLVALAIPTMALWITRFLVFRALGLLNTPLVLLLPALLGGTPLCVLLLYGAFRRIRGEQWDQARIDGAKPWAMWWHIGVPQVRSILAALAALVFTLFWGNFIDPLLYLSGATWQTLPVGLQALQQLARTDWPVLMAGAVLMTLPAIVVFLLAQRAVLHDSTTARILQSSRLDEAPTHAVEQA